MVIVVMLVILGFRMAVLTIVEGEEYRQIADIKKIKDIPVKAPRGKIFDRNGILLADNVSSFTVQMYTDEIKPSDFNDIAYKLSKILDENIERPIDDFPIELDTFDYIDESLEIMDSSADNTEEIEVLTYRTAEETVIERVKENIHEWLNFSTLIYGENFSPKQRVHAALLDDEVPIELKGESFEYIEDMTVPIESEENERDEDAPEIKTPIQIWLSENNLKENLSAEKAVEHLLVNNNKYLSSLFSNSKIRRLSYEFLKKEGLASNIKLNEFSFIQDEEYENIKRNLNASNEEITLSTTAKDDFVILTMKNSIDSLLKTVYKGNEKVKPGEILINRLKEIFTWYLAPGALAPRHGARYHRQCMVPPHRHRQGIAARPWENFMVDKLIYLFYTLQSKNKSNVIAIAAIIAMEFVITAIVSISGGTTSFVHLMYIPIILSVVVFNIKTGIMMSLLVFRNF
jgi:penicillin-binding protein 2